MILAVGGASSSLALTIKILMETVDANRRATATAVAMTCSYSAYALRWVFKLFLYFALWLADTLWLRHLGSISRKTHQSPFIVGTIYGTFPMNETNEDRFHALQQSLLICPAVSLIGAGSFIFARFILTKWLYKLIDYSNSNSDFFIRKMNVDKLHLLIFQSLWYSTHIRISMITCHCSFIKLVCCCNCWNWLFHIFW